MDAPASQDELIDRLERAGATLLALNVGATGPAGYRSCMPEVIHSFEDAYGYTEARIRAVPPDAAAIKAMDEALAWISLIPVDRYVLRRIVGARALVAPLTGRHLFSWARLARSLGAHHEAVKRWHDEGIGMIWRQLGRPGLCAAAGGRAAPSPRTVRAVIARAGARVGTVRSVEFA